MKIKFFFIFLLILLFNAFSLVKVSADEDDEKEKKPPKPIEKVWKLFCIINKEKNKISWPQKDHYMELRNDSMVSILLDINRCTGYYYELDSSNIKIDLKGCSIVCCDGFTALSLTDAFPDTFEYYLSQDSLELHSFRYSILFNNALR